MGYAIGSLVGNAYDPVKIGMQGPRLNDLKVQASNYGKMIPTLSGASRFAGNVIWSTDIVETSHTQGTGGKGGPVTTTTNYTYSQSFAVALCAGIVAGIGRIWANGKLIYNVTSSADAATVAASRKVARVMRFYSGSETQTADSLIQAHVGAANAPAYRGTAYVVFEDFPLAEFGNRMPNMEFEVIEAATIAHPAGEHASFAITSTAGAYGMVFDAATNSVWASNYSSNTISKINPLTGTRVDFGTASSPRGIAYDPVNAAVWVCNYGAASVSKLDAGSGIRTDYAVSTNLPTVITYDSVNKAMWVGCYNGALNKFDTATGIRTVFAAASTTYVDGIAYDPVTNSVWYVQASVLYKMDAGAGTRTAFTLLGSGNAVSVAFDPVTNSVWVARGTAIIKVDVTTGSMVSYATGATNTYDVVFEPISNSVWCTNLTDTKINKFDALTGARTDFALGPFGHLGITYDASTASVWASDYSNASVTRINIMDYGLVSTAPALSAVVSKICAQAGLTAGQIDVTALTDSVTGYVTQRSTARVQIEQLMQAFYFDAVESDGKVKFVKRGGATALTIVEDDVAAHVYGSNVPENLTIDRRQEMELPVEVNVQYMDVDAAYQTNSQRSQRLITSSSNKLALNFAISMNAAKAKQVADVLMYDAWTSRMSFAVMNGWKYSYLEPTDVVAVIKNGRTYTMRLVDEDASGGIYSRNAVMDDSNIYTQSAAAGSQATPGSTVAGAAVINLLLMDIPLLRDQDDGIGFYAASCKYSGTWSGEQTFKSNDGGASWSSFGKAILNEATTGGATTALGNFYGGNTFDQTNFVTVSMTNGTLSSDTELNVLNGANVALLGSEIIQFKTATLVSAGVYTLSGLLRGRQGTEWAMGLHAAGERFVLLNSATTYLMESASSEYNLSRQYRGVAISGFLDDAVTISFTNTAVAEKPYAPVLLGGGRNAANDVLLRWTRRTRIGGGWGDYTDVPLGEASEAYVVEVYSSGTYATLKRTISGITSPTTTYTAAQQTADGLTPGNPVYFIVYQVSAVVGNGYGARGVVP